MMAPGVAVYFVVEGRHLEAQAVLLASSLRRHAVGEVDLIAYRPAVSDAPELTAATRAAFDRAGVRVETFDVPPDTWKKPYPHGNKILASRAPRDADAHVFLDTDMVACAPLDFTEMLGSGAVSMVPDGTPNWGKDGDRWARVYGHFGLDMPEERVRLTRRKRIAFYPYFNAGMIAYWDSYAGGRQTFPETWYETAREIDFNCRVGGKRPWLDQIALPIALRRHALRYNVLEDRYNFSISARAFEPDAAPVLIHYHSFRYTAEWPQVVKEKIRMSEFYGVQLMSCLAAQFGAFWYPKTTPA
ncbi:hypothetical protein SAMN04490244_106250 [Tranquillimonas rosea]|uniref:Glycosyl transferase family 8 n=1 Tax=Tranquillimonas rosea TaxID=641238 RepID=A0A1H9V5B4_9RHOB|nr:hypothetical protein [Tranquillimonas rosea]SES16739.1 hypothetical protein SAMN04490244_106250 [Tranquillimonas rosea]